ncbi:MAG: 16S rRNA (cytidine(1402)-2'-O)-methyltransferase [Anaerolineae bacterium]
MGTLFVVATPIGNLEDITLRALRTLREVRVIAAEDTRTARKLLNRYDIHTPATSYYEHNRALKVPHLLGELEQGDVALISEAGMPGVSDPGQALIRAAIEAGHPVVPIPGPSAVTAAVAVSGLDADRFLFLGFLPRRPAERRALLQSVAPLPYTLVFFEAPHRILAGLADVERILGDRAAACAQELTKLFERVQRGTLSEIRAALEAGDRRGEFTIVVAGAQPQEAEAWPREQVEAALRERLAAGASARDAARDVAKQAGWPARAVYDVSTKIKN